MQKQKPELLAEETRLRKVKHNMFSKLLNDPSQRTVLKKFLQSAALSKYSSLPDTPPAPAAKTTPVAKTQANLQKKKKKKLQRYRSSYLRSGTGSKSKTRSLIDPM